MRATKTLPIDYFQHKTLDLSTTRVVLWLNLAAIPLLFLYGWLFSRIIYYLRIANTAAKGAWDLLSAFSGLELITLIVSILFMFVFHELIHGAFFWLFTGERPKFALKAGYAFASSPDWCLPRGQYILVGISPFLVISILSIIIAIFTPSSIVPYMIYIATFNAAGALGDMIVVFWVLRQSRHILVQDRGDKFISFSPTSK